jgi:hypothetical protein
MVVHVHCTHCFGITRIRAVWIVSRLPTIHSGSGAPHPRVGRDTPIDLPEITENRRADALKNGSRPLLSIPLLVRALRRLAWVSFVA